MLAHILGHSWDNLIGLVNCEKRLQCVVFKQQSLSPSWICIFNYIVGFGVTVAVTAAEGKQLNSGRELTHVFGLKVLSCHRILTGVTLTFTSNDLSVSQIHHIRWRSWVHSFFFIVIGLFC